MEGARRKTVEKTNLAASRCVFRVNMVGMRFDTYMVYPCNLPCIASDDVAFLHMLLYGQMFSALRRRDSA